MAFKFTIAKPEADQEPKQDETIELEWQSFIDEDGDFTVQARRLGSVDWQTVLYVSRRSGVLHRRYYAGLEGLGLPHDCFGGIAVGEIARQPG